MHFTVLSFVLSLAAVQARPSDLWQIHIDKSPAPSPEDGPPASAHADRNPAHLKYEIVGIVGAYLIWLLITLILLVFVGRRLRRKAQSTHGLRQMVLMKPTFPGTAISPRKTTDVDMKSPTKLSIRSWGRKTQNNRSEISISSMGSNGYDEAHRAKNMEELSELYAHVMAHDEEKEARATTISIAMSPSSDDYYSPISPRLPSEIEHSQYSNQLSHPMAPTPVNDQFPDDIDQQLSRTSTTKSRRSIKPLNIISELSDQVVSVMSPRRSQSFKNSRISQPMGSADLRDAHHYSETVPLSPRLYNPGPAPKVPTQRSNTYQQRDAPALPPKESQTQIRTSPAKDRRAPPSLALRNASPDTISSSARTANNPLPFREVYGSQSLRSAPPTKTTFLDRPTKSSGAPRTGVVPSTPYSPYMPYTPMTPVTPRRLVGKEEMKQRRKEQNLKVLQEDDLVIGEDEMWGKVH